MRGHPLVEQAHATLCRLADAPPATEAVKSAIADIERAWDKPFAAGIGGTVPARTELLNFVCEDKVLDPFARALGGAAVRIRRGRPAGFRARRDDGSVEEQPMPPDHASDIAAARARATAARGELDERTTALARIDKSFPKPPARWAVWMWPVYWIVTWLARRKRPERKLANLALAEARAQFEAIENEANAIEAHARLAKARYFESVRNLASGGPIGAGVSEVELTIESARLPEGIDIVELAGASRASAEVDAVFLVQGDRVSAPVRGGDPLELGDHAQLLAALPALLADARALRLAHRVETKIQSVMSSLADAIERKEATFRSRLGRLAALRIDDPAAFTQQQLERVRGEISASVNAVVEHSSVHLGAELAQLQEEWIGAIAEAADTDALKAAVAKIEEEWDARPQRIAEEVRVLVMGGLGGSARDIYPAVAGALVKHGLSEEQLRVRAAPELPPVMLLPSLTKESAKLEKGSWFAGLFRSFETRRTEIREKVYERVERMREVAGSELLDAEPRLNQAIGTALAGLLEGAIATQQAWLDDALDQEHEAIARDREVIAPLVAVHDAVRTEANRLGEMIGQLEQHQPAIAGAAAAADTASLSR